jgi:hypothetical protein
VLAATKYVNTNATPAAKIIPMARVMLSMRPMIPAKAA